MDQTVLRLICIKVFSLKKELRVPNGSFAIKLPQDQGGNKAVNIFRPPDMGMSEAEQLSFFTGPRFSAAAERPSVKWKRGSVVGHRHFFTQTSLTSLP